MLDEDVVSTVAISNVLTVLPMGGTVATGSACILETPLMIGGTATVGKTCVRVPAGTVCTSGVCFLIDVLLSPECIKTCG